MYLNPCVELGLHFIREFVARLCIVNELSSTAFCDVKILRILDNKKIIYTS